VGDRRGRGRAVGLGLLATLTLLAGCAGPVATYPGPRRSPEEVATLRASHLSRVLRIDGRDQGGKSFELLPGEHDLHVKFERRLADLDQRFANSGETMRAYCDVRFFAKAGHQYRLYLSFEPDAGVSDEPSKVVHYFGFYLYMVDVTDGRVLEDAIDQRNCHLPRDKNA